MFDLPKLIFLVLVGAVLWWFVRLGKRISQARARQAVHSEQRRPRRKVDPSQAEDLVACSVCGAYVAVGAPQCRRPNCPRPR